MGAWPGRRLTGVGRVLRRPALLALLASVTAAAVVAAATLEFGVVARLVAASPHPHGTTASQQATPHPGSRPLRIAFIGASITRGWYATSVQDAYPAVTARLLAHSRGRAVDWRVVALPGAPVADVLTWHVPQAQDIVVVHVVSNDFLYGTPLPDYQARYHALMGRIRKVSPGAQIVCMGDWGTVGATNQLGTSAYAYDTVVSQECAGVHGTYVPINQDYSVAGARGPAGYPSLFGPTRGTFHPNDLGDRLIANSIMQGLNGSPPVEQVPPPPAAGVPPRPARTPHRITSQPQEVSGHVSQQT